MPTIVYDGGSGSAAPLPPAPGPAAAPSTPSPAPTSSPILTPTVVATVVGERPPTATVYVPPPSSLAAPPAPIVTPAPAVTTPPVVSAPQPVSAPVTAAPLSPVASAPPGSVLPPSAFPLDQGPGALPPPAGASAAMLPAGRGLRDYAGSRAAGGRGFSQLGGLITAANPAGRSAVPLRGLSLGHGLISFAPGDQYAPPQSVYGPGSQYRRVTAQGPAVGLARAAQFRVV